MPCQTPCFISADGVGMRRKGPETMGHFPQRRGRVLKDGGHHHPKQATRAGTPARGAPRKRQTRPLPSLDPRGHGWNNPRIIRD